MTWHPRSSTSQNSSNSYQANINLEKINLSQSGQADNEKNQKSMEFFKFEATKDTQKLNSTPKDFSGLPGKDEITQNDDRYRHVLKEKVSNNILSNEYEHVQAPSIPVQKLEMTLELKLGLKSAYDLKFEGNIAYDINKPNFFELVNSSCQACYIADGVRTDRNGVVEMTDNVNDKCSPLREKSASYIGIKGIDKPFTENDVPSMLEANGDSDIRLQMKIQTTNRAGFKRYCNLNCPSINDELSNNDHGPRIVDEITYSPTNVNNTSYSGFDCPSKENVSRNVSFNVTDDVSTGQEYEEDGLNNILVSNDDHGPSYFSHAKKSDENDISVSTGEKKWPKNEVVSPKHMRKKYNYDPCPARYFALLFASIVHCVAIQHELI